MRQSLLYTAVAAILLAPVAPPRRGMARETPQTTDYSLSNGATIRLSPDWIQQPPTTTPPVSLASSAPPVNFYELQTFQNGADYSRLEFALSNNPFLGRDAYWLDGQMHRPASESGMVAYLFYFFFPPPQSCLGSAASQYDRAARDAGDDKDPRDVSVNLDCQYAPTPSDLYSFLISPSVTFRRNAGSEHREGALRDFHLEPIDQRDINGMTFFIFEAQGQQQISLGTANHFNLPDSLQGTQPAFLWAIGAPSPFPFVRDVTRQNVPLVHVVYAGLAFGAYKKPDFLRLLNSVHIQ
jgi:hypothetical protein